MLNIRVSYSYICCAETVAEFRLGLLIGDTQYFFHIAMQFQFCFFLKNVILNNTHFMVSGLEFVHYVRAGAMQFFFLYSNLHFRINF
jgi:hypothetical protein